MARSWLGNFHFSNDDATSDGESAPRTKWQQHKKPSRAGRFGSNQLCLCCLWFWRDELGIWRIVGKGTRFDEVTGKLFEVIAPIPAIAELI